MLKEAVLEAEAIFINKVKALAALQQRAGVIGKAERITRDSVIEFLGKVTHNPNGRHKKLHNYATAYYRKRQVIYNPKWLKKMELEDDYDNLLDTVLHELGHLFEYHFFRTSGHGHNWKAIGSIVGYAEVGSTSPARRRRRRSYAAHAGTVDVHDKMLGTVGRVTQQRRRYKDSTVDNPVEQVHVLCDTYVPLGYSRKEIIAECVALGINPNTASTQYYHWKKAHPEYSL